MSSNTFDRPLVITDPQSIPKIIEFLLSEPPKEPLSLHPYGSEERKRSEELFKRYSYRFK